MMQPFSSSSTGSSIFNNTLVFNNTMTQQQTSSNSLFGNNLNQPNSSTSNSIFGASSFSQNKLPFQQPFGNTIMSSSSSHFGNLQSTNNIQNPISNNIFGNSQYKINPSYQQQPLFSSNQQNQSVSNSSSMFGNFQTSSSNSLFNQSNSNTSSFFNNTAQLTNTCQSIFGNSQKPNLSITTPNTMFGSQTNISTFGNSQVGLSNFMSNTTNQSIFGNNFTQNSLSNPITSIFSSGSVTGTATNSNNFAGMNSNTTQSTFSSMGQNFMLGNMSSNLFNNNSNSSLFNFSNTISTAASIGTNFSSNPQIGQAYTTTGLLNFDKGMENVNATGPSILGQLKIQAILPDGRVIVIQESNSTSYLQLDPTLEQVANFLPTWKEQFEKIEENLLAQEKFAHQMKEEFEPLKKLNESVQHIYESELSTVQTIECINLHIDYTHSRKIETQITSAKQITHQIQKLFQQLLQNKEYLEQEKLNLSSRYKELSIQPIQVPSSLTLQFYQDMLELVSIYSENIYILQENLKLQKSGYFLNGLYLIKDVIQNNSDILKIQSDKILNLKRTLEMARSLMEKQGYQIPPFDINSLSLFNENR